MSSSRAARLRVGDELVSPASLYASSPRLPVSSVSPSASSSVAAGAASPPLSAQHVKALRAWNASLEEKLSHAEAELSRMRGESELMQTQLRVLHGDYAAKTDLARSLAEQVRSLGELLLTNAAALQVRPHSACNAARHRQCAVLRTLLHNCDPACTRLHAHPVPLHR